MKKITSSISIFILFVNFSSLVLASSLMPDFVVPANTNIRLINNTTTITASTSQAGTQVIFTVMDDVKIDGQVVIKSGAIATGIISSLKKAAIVGQPGSIGVNLTSVTAVDGTQIPILASAIYEGENKMTTSVIIGFLCLFGFLMEGGEGEVQVGSTIVARTLSDVSISL